MFYHARTAGLLFVGLQPTVIASRASPPLLEQSSSMIDDSKNRGRASPVKPVIRSNLLSVLVRRAHPPAILIFEYFHILF